MSGERAATSRTLEERAHARSSARVAPDIDALGPWFHNLHLPDGRETAPAHPLGDFPADKWRAIAGAIPADLEGWHVLDVGCNAGFYSFKLAERGARVTAIDVDERYLAQARWAAPLFGLADRVELHRASVYDAARAGHVYDLVCFMGVFYHLRHPLLALDGLAACTRRLMIFQTLTAPGREDGGDAPGDVEMENRALLGSERWPKMSFIERRFAGDPTNWWAPDPACVEALLRSTGLRVVERPGHEVYICEPSREGPASIRDGELADALGCARDARGGSAARRDDA